MKIALIVVAVLLSGCLSAQMVISGTVKDHKGKPVAGAAITLLNTYDGAVADSTGHFSFTSTEKGLQKIQVTSSGFNTWEQEVTVTEKGAVTINAALKEKIDELQAVVVTAGSFAAGDAKRGAVLSSMDILTTGGANADISTALKTLPGAQQVSDQEGLFVRGGTGYETKQFIDGTLVNNPYYSSVPNIATRGRFSPTLFKGMVFSTGGYSALYGQALSAALVMESIDIPEKSEIDLSLSPIFAGVSTQQIARDKKSSWGGSYNYTNLNAYFKLVKQTPDYFRMPVFHNGDANFRIKTNSGGIIKYYSTFSHSDLGLRRMDIDSVYLKDAFGLANTNWYNNLSWRENLGNKWKMQLGAGYSYNKDDISQQIQDAANNPKEFTTAYWMTNKNFTYRNKEEVAQLRAVFEKKLQGINSIRFGSEYWYSHNPGQYKDTIFNTTDNYNALFAESNIYLTNDLAATLGGRLEHSSIINKTVVAPRAAFAYKTGKGAQVSFAYGIFFQKPENTQLRYTTNMGFTKATHYIINYQKTTSLQVLRIEAYYKKYGQLVKNFPAYNNNGSGYARGAELFWRDRKSIKNFDYWISYSYLDTKRDYLNYPRELQPNFAAGHTVSVVAKRFFTSLKTGFNLTYSIASGRPYYNFLLNGTGDKYQISDQGKTKPYQNLGFSMNYVPQLGKTRSKSFLVLVASVTNVLGNQQLAGYNYSFDGSVKQPIVPPAKRFFLIAAFISFGVDRTDDVINNNL